MPELKLTTWNIAHLERLISPAGASTSPRLLGIADEISQISPDILCVVEAPGDLPAFRDWVGEGLGGRYHVPIIDGTAQILAGNPPNARSALQDLYAMDGTDETGSQWIWFLVRDGLFQAANATLLNPIVWRHLTGQTTWLVHPWGTTTARRHGHWRHPQTLLLNIDGFDLEIIGVHLKSKINRKRAFDAANQLKPDYVNEAHRARADLTTEAYDVRRYIDGRFGQEPNPRILVCGDMNDGPGRDYFEREYLYFDLVSNIQGEVFFARRFLNHALFDFDDQFRWSTSFHDKIEEWARQQPGATALPVGPVDSARHQLLDHILFTQALVGANARPRVRPGAGLVEHTIHRRVNATLTQANQTSDHTPVSVTITY